MKAKEAREKYFEDCIDIETKLMEIKKFVVFDSHINLSINGRYSHFEDEFLKYFRDKVVPSFEEHEKEQQYLEAENIIKSLNKIYFFYFLEAYAFKTFNNAFTELYKTYKWTNYHGKEILTSSIEIWNGTELINKRVFDYLHNIISAQYISLPALLPAPFGLSKEESESVTMESFNRYSRARNHLAHFSGIQDIDENDSKFFEKELPILLRYVSLGVNRICTREKDTKRFPIVNDHSHR